ncbi:MAG: HipA family kinase [Bacteroidota bacterium]
MTLADASGKRIGEYVVKVFKPNNLQQVSNTGREVYGSILAAAFDLNSPKAVLANVDQGIINILNRSEKYKDFELMKGIYFATEFIENATDYNERIARHLETWEIETIFAFDVFIRNQDRHKRKPNLFFKDKSVYFIDHELSFATVLMDKSFKEMLSEQQKYWEFVEIEKHDFQRKHLFLDALRERNRLEPVEFDTFRTYLRAFDAAILDDYYKQLSDLGNEIEDYYYIKSYLTEVK